VPPGRPYARLRRKGEDARARLASRNRTQPASKTNPAPAKKAPSPPSQRPARPRRVTPAEKRAAARRLAARVAKIERELKRPGLAPSSETRLREDLAAPRTLLRAWDDDVH
jgi:hypothetical protein